MRKSRVLKYGIPAIELHKPELHNTQCSIIYAALLLSISRQHLYRLIKGYGVSIIKTKGCSTISYKDIISILEKLDTNSDCPLCPASLSLRGLMKLTNRSRCWSLKFIDRYQIHSFHIGNSRRFAYHEVKSSLDHERDSTSEWQDFDNAIRTFGIRKQTMINIIVDGRVKYLCKSGKLLVNIKDIKHYKKIRYE